MSDTEVNFILAMILERMISTSTRISITANCTDESSSRNIIRKWKLFTWLVMLSKLRFNGLSLAFNNIHNSISKVTAPVGVCFRIHFENESSLSIYWMCIIIIIIIIIVIRLLSQAFPSWLFSWTSSDPQCSGIKLHTAVLSVLCVMFQV
jgi:hypothetical protein